MARSLSGRIHPGSGKGCIGCASGDGRGPGSIPINHPKNVNVHQEVRILVVEDRVPRYCS